MIFQKLKILLSILFLLISSQSISQVNLNSIKSYNGTASAEDSYSSIVTDNAGNIYATGYATDDICSYIFTVKYNSTGTILWSEIYRSRDNGYDFPVSIATDSSGNVYVAGNSKSPNNTYNLLLIKYNSLGDTLWTRTYNGSANGDDRAVKVAVDRNNDIILSGNSNESGQGLNVVIIKYNQNGNILWLRTYDNTSHLNNILNDFTLDKNNFICIAGISYLTQTSGERFYILRLNPSGDSVWTKTFKGTGNNDEAFSIVTDDSLNVYATGCLSGTSYYTSFFTVKVNSAGITKWTAEYSDGQYHSDRSLEIGLDELGNVIIAGELRGIITDNTIFDYGTIKYSNSGQQIWLKKSKPGLYLTGLNLIVKNSSNIYLYHPSNFLGLFYDKTRCIKYDSNGDSVWVKVLEGQYELRGLKAFVIDSFGNLIFSSYTYKTTGMDAAIQKYDMNGNFIWENYFESEGFSTDYGRFIGEDSQGNIYVSGYNRKEYLIIKYNSSFEQQWVTTYADDNTYPNCFSITDDQGNTYLAGSTYESFGVLKTVLLKYNTSGSLVWQKTFSSGLFPEMNDGICFDRDGNLLITGFVTGGGIKVIKCTPTGTILFSKIFSPPYNYYYIYSIETDYDNNIIICGSYGAACLIKLNSSGDKIWEKSFGTTYVHCFYNFSIDKKNNIYTCGYTGVQNQRYNFLTTKYDSSGNLVWYKDINGIRNDEDFARDIVVDTLNNVYVTGELRNNPSNFNTSLFTIKYDSSGFEKWRKEYRMTNNGNLRSSMIKKDKYNKIYILCRYHSYLSIQAGYFTIKYNSNGDSLWSFTYNSPIAKNFGNDILIRNAEKLYITGRAYGNNTGYDIVTLELSQTNDIKKIGSEVPQSYNLEQNYPNPFNPSTNIRFDIPRSSHVKLIIYDALGREVATLVNEKLSAGSYETEWLGSSYPSGVYFYRIAIHSDRIETKNFSESKKMILIK